MPMDQFQLGTPAAGGPLAVPDAPGSRMAAPRTGAFSKVRARWLPVWTVLGAVAVMAVAYAVAAALGVGLPDELVGVLLYLPMVAWVWFVVVRRNGVDLSVMLRWPRLGTYWWAVAGLFVVQLLFSLGAVTLTQLVFPGLTDSLEGVGEGNLVLAILGLAILPPLVEEVVFRGILVERLSVKWRTSVAVIVSAVAFGILHVDPVGAGMFGLMTGLLYLRTGSLWPGILIHFANNLLALVAARTATADAAAQAPGVTESLVSAGMLLVLSVPFLAWFIIRNWPRTRALTPYQQFESGPAGLAPSVFPDVVWSAAAAPVRLTATATHLIVDLPGGAAGESSHPLAVLPIEQVASAYPANIPGGQVVVVLLDDGTWTTLRVGYGDPGPTAELARAITERAAGAR
jgi:membrane protease YdiL (CAAX protease family)